MKTEVIVGVIVMIILAAMLIIFLNKHSFDYKITETLESTSKDITKCRPYCSQECLTKFKEDYDTCFDNCVNTCTTKEIDTSKDKKSD